MVHWPDPVVIQSLLDYPRTSSSPPSPQSVGRYRIDKKIKKNNIMLCQVTDAFFFVIVMKSLNGFNFNHYHGSGYVPKTIDRLYKSLQSANQHSTSTKSNFYEKSNQLAFA